MYNSGASSIYRYDTMPEPYSATVVDDLLKGISEWRNIQDIIRLTFKALSDVVKAQGQGIQELERQMQTRVTKAELQSAVSNKANATDVSSWIAEVQAGLNSRVPYLDIQNVLDEKISRADLQYLLGNKVSVEEVRNMLEAKASSRDMENELLTVNSRIDDIQRELTKKLAILPTEKDLQMIYNQLQEKANIKELDDILQAKANKQTVASALHKKVNRADLDIELQRKADIGHIETINSALALKADLEYLDKLSFRLEDKLDRNDLNTTILPELRYKVSRGDFDNLAECVQEDRQLVQKRMDELNHDLNTCITEIRNEIDALRASILTTASRKAEVKDLDKLSVLINKKADADTMSEMLAIQKREYTDMLNSFRNESKADRAKIEDLFQDRAFKSDQLSYKLNDDLGRMQECINVFINNQKQELDENSKTLRNLSHATRTELREEFHRLRDDVNKHSRAIDELKVTKCDRTEFMDTRGKLLGLIEEKVDLKELESVIEKRDDQLIKTVEELKESFGGWVKDIEEELQNRLAKKVNISEIPELMQEKMDASHGIKIMNSKASQEDMVRVKQDLAEMRQIVSKKAEQEDLEVHISSTKSALQDVGKDMMLKASIKDVCNLLDSKAALNDVNSALTEIHNELDLKVSLEDYENHVTEQGMIIETLCSENYVGRWIWKSGDLRAGLTIPWEIQAINTSPENFVWEQDKTTITVMTPGLYEINFGFYARKKPSVELLVNGKVVTSAVNTASYVLHHSSGRLKSKNPHPDLHITGLTLIDFLALPPGAKMTLTYNGEVGEGFLGLRKL